MNRDNAPHVCRQLYLSVVLKDVDPSDALVINSVSQVCLDLLVLVESKANQARQVLLPPFHWPRHLALWWSNPA
jgi:hypothetical protein